MYDVRQASRFYGRWYADVDQQQIFLEFYPDGRLAYTGLWGEDTSEYMRQMHHPLDIHRTTTIPRWELQDDQLIISLNPQQQYAFEYSFSESDQALSLTSLKTKETLTFSRKA